METKLLLIPIFLLCYQVSFCQITHVQGVKGIELNYAHTLDGQGISFGYSSFLSEKSYLKGELLYDWGTDEDRNKDFSSITADFGGAYTLTNIDDYVYINAIGGATFSIEQVKEAEAYGTDSDFNFGAFVGTEIEGYISPKVALLVNANYRYRIKEAFGRTRWYLKFGIKLNL